MFWGPLLAAGVTAAGSFIGGRQANIARRKEANKNRAFQERMRNTAWQAAVDDMTAAGINPALAYSQGPASSPGGSMAQQMDAISPAISSAMQMRRMNADLQLLKAQTEKTQAEAEGAQYDTTLKHGRLLSYGIDRTRAGSINIRQGQDEPYSLIERETRATIDLLEQQARQKRAGTDIMLPMADLSKRLGEWLPIIGLLSQIQPGGILRSRRGLKLIRGKS